MLASTSFSSLRLRPASFTFAILLTLGSPCFANTPAATPAQQEAIKNLSPEMAFIQNLGDKALSVLANKTLPPDQRDATFRQLLEESFDLNTIARFVIGRSWRSATPEQQKEYLSLFESLVVKTYSDRFALYTRQGFKVVSSTPEGTKDYVVNSEITHPDGSAGTNVVWRVRQKDNKFGIIDVVVEGVSMSVTQRQEYASIIQRNGGDINALLKIMRERVGTPAKA
ncbi:MAG: ABC transporter substrate-binding protein [Alphaproteobacteria bacterium]|nr:ABC transporter substrate-binding protein [Alphaproteobacteria bacterium]